MHYNTDINIIGSIPDYHLIYKALPLIYKKDGSIYTALVTDNEFQFRTEKSRKRFLSAVTSAFVYPQEEMNELAGVLIQHYATNQQAQALILFWLFSFNNPLFYELNRDVFLNYYHQGRAELPVTDVEAYLKDLIGRTPSLKGRWSEITVKTIASKYLTVLKKMSLLEGANKKKFCFVSISDELLACFIHLLMLIESKTTNFLKDERAIFSFVSDESMLDRLKGVGKKGWIQMNYTGTALRVENSFDHKQIINGIFGTP